jgi:hypothetical protein
LKIPHEDWNPEKAAKIRNGKQSQLELGKFENKNPYCDVHFPLKNISHRII